MIKDISTLFTPFLTEEKPLSGFSAPVEEAVCGRIGRAAEGLGFPVHFSRALPEMPEALRGNPESFAVFYTGAEAWVMAKSEPSMLWAISTLSVLPKPEKGNYLALYDAPDLKVRGYRIFLPARAHFEEFYAMLDLLEELRLNAVILEIGGAMEYARHPEINAAWKAFAEDMHSHSGRTHEIQMGYDWEKNSIHVDNAEGDILTQAEVRQLIKACYARNLKVYPEVPCLSHADYICLAHPGLAERAEDPYPDTYCPSNPESYRILFDILDEVTGVFSESEYIHIGHDEYYSACLCPQCRDKDPAAVYAEDIKKIRDYLVAKGKKCIMWSEKLLKAYYPDGTPIGGTGVPGRIPVLWPCRDLIPRDITMMHWYWYFGKEHDKVYHERSFPVVFGNFEAFICPDYRERVNAGIKGGFSSNWGGFDPRYMQRNHQYLMLFFNAAAFWSHDYDSPMRDALYEKVLKASYAYWCSTLKKPLELYCRTNAYIPHKYFYDGVFVEDEKCLLGQIRLTYPDGAECFLPLHYGFRVGNDGSDPAFKANADSADYRELSHAAVPEPLSDGLWYRTAFEDPRLDAAPSAADFIPENKNLPPFRVEIRLI